MATLEELKAKYANEKRLVAVASNIRWDTDGEEVPDLPTQEELIVGEDILVYYGCPTMKDIENAVSDYLSNEYGFCHFGFELAII